MPRVTIKLTGIMASSWVLLLSLTPVTSAVSQSFLAQSNKDLRAADYEVDSLVEQHEDNKDIAINPNMIIAVVAVVVLVLLVAVFIRQRGAGSNYNMAFGNKSGLSTSSSDITSSETGSTDKELKSRMERFEMRLAEHKKMLEAKDETGSSSVTDSDSKSSYGVWMKK
eukprot:gnl/MRDRNA2_/MRDRNA2_122130_c0_seq1.p1 gnl/MRDRNA2_/MRDRNA2_122130_c0~~gnl/MRDRNA2_/MRDRNA2_122130_c0_seq1.p1  ORF type:complete len:186 (+),score=35.91 gnl/MRDRNA2_/MRDRNA2_122130_c0_seq1:55-558(+)